MMQRNKRERSAPEISPELPWSPSEDIKQLNLDTSERGASDSIPSRKKSRTSLPELHLPALNTPISTSHIPIPHSHPLPTTSLQAPTLPPPTSQTTLQPTHGQYRSLIPRSQSDQPPAAPQDILSTLAATQSPPRHRLSRAESESATVGELQNLWFVDDLNKVRKLDPNIELSPSGLTRCLAGKKMAKMGASLTSPFRRRAPLSLDKKNALKALLVDDIVVTVRLTLHSLHRAGYDTDTAVNGRMAVEMAKRLEYDVILMDVKLPVMNGVEATQQIRQFEKEHKRKAALIFGLTGLVGKENLASYQLAGMDGCIEKGCIIAEAVRYGTSEKKTNPEFLFISPATCVNLRFETYREKSPAPLTFNRRIGLQRVHFSTSPTSSSSSASSSPTTSTVEGGGGARGDGGQFENASFDNRFNFSDDLETLPSGATDPFSGGSIPYFSSSSTPTPTTSSLRLQQLQADRKYRTSSSTSSSTTSWQDFDLLTEQMQRERRAGIEGGGAGEERSKTTMATTPTIATNPAFLSDSDLHSDASGSGV